MSGSLPGGGPKAEPNLTPILDMVFQLITFFMLVLNFKAAELDLSLQLPVLASAKPLREEDKHSKFLVLNVEVATKCPHAGCDGLATLQRVYNDDKKLIDTKLVCDLNPQHEESLGLHGVITNGQTCLSVYRRLLAKQPRDKDILSIEQYLKQEAFESRLAANLTEDEIVHEGKELPDTVVVRADTTCRFGAVSYIITKCQELGYRKFALKTMHKVTD